MDPMPAETAFGEVTLPGDGACFMDGGTHGCVGHTLALLPGGTCEWERRIDSMGDPADCSGSGTRGLSERERRELEGLLDAVWHLAGSPPAPPVTPETFEPARYQWAIAMRRGDVVRILEGPPLTHPFEESPAEVGAVRDWAYRHVLDWCGGTAGT